MNSVERLEQDEIHAALQREREIEPSKYTLPDHEGEALEPRQVGRFVLENTADTWQELTPVLPESRQNG